jgi:hypothetical protein
MTSDDDLDSLLGAADADAGAPPESFRNLTAKVRHAHREQATRRTRVHYGLAFAGCYLAGVLTMWGAGSLLAQSVEVADAPPAATRSDDSGKNEPSVDKRGEPKGKPRARRKFVPLSRYELLRQLGDENVMRSDYSSAVSYYNRALDAATHDELGISYGRDNAILISLKKERTSQTSGQHGDST